MQTAPRLPTGRPPEPACVVRHATARCHLLRRHQRRSLLPESVGGASPAILLHVGRPPRRAARRKTPPPARKLCSVQAGRCSDLFLYCKPRGVSIQICAEDESAAGKPCRLTPQDPRWRGGRGGVSLLPSTPLARLTGFHLHLRQCMLLLQPADPTYAPLLRQAPRVAGLRRS